MIIHPVATLTKANEPHYRALDEAKQQLAETVDVDERIRLIGVIGAASAEILRLLRNEQSSETERLQAIINEQREQIALLRKQGTVP